MGVRKVGVLLNESAQADAVGHGRPVVGIPAIHGGEDVKALSPDKHAIALEIARIPELIKGYGHVKVRHLITARAQWNVLLLALRQMA